MRTVVGDIEADGLLDEATQVWCGVFKDINTGEMFEFTPGYIKEMLAFLDKEVGTLIIHNGVGYDFPLLRKLYGWEFGGTKVDTLLMSRLQRPSRPTPPQCPKGSGPHSIQAWGYRVGRGKPHHEDWSVYSEAMLHRCREDVEILHLVHKALLNEGEGEGWEPAHRLTCKLFENLQRQQEYGWTVDQEHIDFAIHMLTKWIGKIDDAINPRLPLKVEIGEVKKDGEYNYVRKPFRKDGSYADIVHRWDPDCSVVCGPFSRVGFRHLDLDKNQEIKDYLLDQGWQPAEWNTNSKGEKTSPKMSKDDPFEGIEGKVGKLIAKRIQCRQRRGVLEGWKEATRDDGRIPSVVNGLTLTGRARHSIIANVPRPDTFFGKWMRKCFIAREGWVLVGTDSTANHYRTLAAWMGDPVFKEAVLEGDMHSLNQERIGEGTRSQAKVFFYALLLGAQPPRLAKVLGCTPQRAKALRERFMGTMPGLQKLLDRLVAEWKENANQVYNPRWNRIELVDGWFSGLDGRPVFCESESSILGYALQNAESTMMAAAYNIFHKWMDQLGYKWAEDYGTVCWYHDEWTVECRPEIAKEVGALAEKAIAWAGTFYNIDCPHKGEAKIGKSWADIH